MKPSDVLNALTLLLNYHRVVVLWGPLEISKSIVDELPPENIHFFEDVNASTFDAQHAVYTQLLTDPHIHDKLVILSCNNKDGFSHMPNFFKTHLIHIEVDHP
jgi:hypothetical protein